MTAHSSILAWRIPMDRGAWQATVLRVTKRQTLLKQPTESMKLLLKCQCFFSTEIEHISLKFVWHPKRLNSQSNLEKEQS